MRIEADFLGSYSLGEELYGIHTARGIENFPRSGEPVHIALLASLLDVKHAAANANVKLGFLSPEKHEMITGATCWLKEKLLDPAEGAAFAALHFPTDPYQGGAGTTLHMNVNEVICNAALLRHGNRPGDYHLLHPIDDVNCNQSTNDVLPTAVKIAALRCLKTLTEDFAQFQGALQVKEKEFRHILKLGRTQLQDAVPITLGQEFGAWAQAAGRDRWRIYNAEERLRSVNIGGTAVGNSAGTPNNYVLEIYKQVRSVTGLPIARAEDLIDQTQNCDVYAEVHGIIKAGAVNASKIANDLRLLSSGPRGGLQEIVLPPLQAGSSIMPGKVNPVIPENVLQVAELVFGHDAMLNRLCAAGNLELNQHLPMIAHLLIKSITMLGASVRNMARRCISGITANESMCRKHLMESTAVSVLFIRRFGYDTVAACVKRAEGNGEAFLNELAVVTGVSRAELEKTIQVESGAGDGNNS